MNLQPLHILSPALDSLPWLKLDPNARTDRAGDRFRVTFRVEVDKLEVEFCAEHPDACMAYSLARYMAVSAALRDLPEHREAELRALGHTPAWRRPEWLREDPRT